MTQLTVDQAMQLAVQNHQAGKLSDAEEIYRRVLTQQPNHSDALHLLGVICHQTAQPDAAIDLIRRAIAINPGIAQYHNNLGNALRDKGFSDEAIAAYRNAVRLKPDYSDAHYNLAVALRAQGQIDQAIAAYRNALSFKPEFADAHNDLGSALRETGSLDEAIASLREGIRLQPDLHKAHNNLANALHEKGRLDEAIAALRQALQIKPDIAELHNNLGNILRDDGLLDDAVAALRQSIRLKPDFAEAHYNLGIALLLKGDLPEGWSKYEWRWRCKNVAAPRSGSHQPRWDGADLTGRTILLQADAGFGDTIQFIRYVPLVAARGGKVVLECPPQLHRLLQALPGLERLISANQPLPQFDVHCPLTSLPLAFGTKLETIPAQIPYLNANDDLSRRWAKLLADSDGLKVGIVWAGNPRHSNDRNRSLSLSLLAPLARNPGITFYSLRKGGPPGQISAPPSGIKLIDYTAELTDFADTAALIANLDLIIAADTAVAHLAAALGKPVWVLLPYAPDWRWQLEREDSPWYPTMRLFRQKTWGDWPEVIERAAQTLDAYRVGREKRGRL
jgi:tetratricopeptide (TPR) repeat protein